jgi:Asp-tRNA(Asn)/Glu-tRNA(Gln) amidotransferase C subunit
VPDAILEETALALTQMLDLIQQLPAFEVEHSQIGPTLSRREDVPHSLGKASLIALSKGHEGDFVLVPPVLKS